MIAMRAVVEPIETEHFATQTTFKSQQGVFGYMQGLARQQNLVYAARIFDTLRDRDQLAEMEFMLDETPPDDTYPDYIDDQKMASVLSDLARSVYYHEVLLMMSYSYRPPLAFACLVDPGEAVRTRAMEWFEELLTTLYKFEKLALEDPCRCAWQGRTSVVSEVLRSCGLRFLVESSLEPHLFGGATSHPEVVESPGPLVEVILRLCR